MMRKAALLVGLAAGYVLGARDGRERYEQIKSKVTQVAQDPRVQEKASQATEAVRAKAPGLADKVASTVGSATGGHSGGGSGGDPGTGTTTGEGLGTPAPATLDALDEEVVVIPAAPAPIDGGHDV